MIESGEKKEEYREFKPYWESRLCCHFPHKYAMRDFEIIIFKNGYNKNARTMSVECNGIVIGFPSQHNDWCDEEDKSSECFVIKLGKIISTTTPNNPQ